MTATFAVPLTLASLADSVNGAPGVATAADRPEEAIDQATAGHRRRGRRRLRAHRLADLIETRIKVTDPNGRLGVWFFSLDVPRTAIVAVARSAFALGYCWAHGKHVVKDAQHRYRIERRWPAKPAGMAEMDFTVGDQLAPNEVTELDHFLTARWALLTQRRERLKFGRVNHPRWPLHHVDNVVIHQNIIEAAGLLAPSGEPHARYTPGVDVRVAWFRSVATNAPLTTRNAANEE